MILVDTSIWIEVFRARRPLDLEAVGDFTEFVTCLPVVQEVLQGFREEQAYRKAREAMLPLPIVE
jgi:predicted nucleic acid-binding protein